ncbi:hypothetical protein Tco_0163612 [Tanacetum coccineum]
MKAIFTLKKTEVAKCSIDKKYFEIEKKELSLDNDRLLEHIICQDVMNIVMHANDHHDNVLPANNNSLVYDNSALHRFVDEYEENLKLQTKLANKNAMIEKAVYNKLSKRSQLEAKNVSIAKLKEHIANLKRKNIIESIQNVHNSNLVTSKVYKLDLPPLSSCIKNNMAAHVDYLKHTQANADILREIVKDAKELRPLDSNLASALSCSAEARGSNPRSNTHNDRIPQTSCRNKKKNKVEDQPRIAKSSLNNVNRISKTVCSENIKHFVLNANSELVCATCHECMFDAIHD